MPTPVRILAAIGLPAIVIAAVAIAGVVLLDGDTGTRTAVAQPPVEQVQAALDDGRVSYDELEAAAEATRQCFIANGVTPHFTPGEGLRRTKIGWEVPAGDSGKPAAEVMAAVGQCRVTHYDDISSAYLAQDGPPSAAAVDAAFDYMEACIASGGRPEFANINFGSAGYRTTRILQVTPDQGAAYAQCAVALETETGMMAPGASFQ